MQKFIFLNQNCRSLTGARSNVLVTVVTNKWLLYCNQFSSVIAFAFCHVLLGFWGYTHSIVRLLNVLINQLVLLYPVSQLHKVV